jgi:hypothetical protein
MVQFYQIKIYNRIIQVLFSLDLIAPPPTEPNILARMAVAKLKITKHFCEYRQLFYAGDEWRDPADINQLNLLHIRFGHPHRTTKVGTITRFGAL